MSFSDRSIWLNGGKNVTAMAKFQGVSPSDFDRQMSEVLFTSCLCPTFPVNGLVFFCFLLCVRCLLCYCGCVTKLEGSISLPYLIGNLQICYSYISALIFGWMDVIPFLKGNGINKKPIRPGLKIYCFAVTRPGLQETCGSKNFLRKNFFSHK